jgi:two-component system phosphate regulon response regulator OmpR
MTLVRSLRRSSRVPILMLTAMADSRDRIKGLERGADDYMVKPFEPRELVLRIRNILQRVPRPSVATEFRLGACRLDLARGELYRGGDPVHLTSGETALLLALARRAGEAVSREALSEEAQFSGNVRTVDVQVTRLRRKIERDPKFPRYLQTVRGTGYVLKPD